MELFHAVTALIVQLVNISAEQFRQALDGHGFADSDRIMRSLRDRGFIEVRNGMITPAISTAKFIDAILQKHPVS